MRSAVLLRCREIINNNSGIFGASWPATAGSGCFASLCGRRWLGPPHLSPGPGQGDHGSRRCCVCALQDTSVLHLGLARLALPRGMRGRELPPAGEIPIRTLFLCCNLRGKKKKNPNPNRPFSSCR